MMVTQEQADAIRAIIARLNAQQSHSPEEAERRHRAYFASAFDAMLETGQTYGQATGAPGMATNSGDEQAFRERLRGIDNDMTEQARIVAEGVEHYFQHGLKPPPYYAWRIAVILHREKQYELEADFLQAFSEKFPASIGGRYKDISERAQKAREFARRAGNT